MHIKWFIRSLLHNECLMPHETDIIGAFVINYCDIGNNFNTLQHFNCTCICNSATIKVALPYYLCGSHLSPMHFVLFNFPSGLGLPVERSLQELRETGQQLRECLHTL